MSVVATSAHFKENAHEALSDARLQSAMSFSRNFVVAARGLGCKAP